MSEPLALIAAGGTGGHMFPAQSLAEMLLANGWRVRLSTDERGARYAGGFPDAVERQVVRSATTARGGVAGKLAAPFKIASGVLAARRAFRRDRPDVVVGFGGYPTIPALSAAWSLGLPRMIDEQNGVMGRVNRLFAGRVHRVACGIWPTDLPQGISGLHVGNPVRAAVLDHAASPYQAPGQGDLHLLVIGGSQGARVLSDLVPAALAALPDDMRTRLIVSHQARAEDADRVTKTYADAGIRANVQPFFTDVPERLAQAQLVISRSGASSLADITVIGRPSILIPFAAAAGDHQTANARGLVEAGAAIMVPERMANPESLGQQIEMVLGDSHGALQMSRAALSVGRPQAAEALAQMVEALGQEGTEE